MKKPRNKILFLALALSPIALFAEVSASKSSFAVCFPMGKKSGETGLLYLKLKDNEGKPIAADQKIEVISAVADKRTIVVFAPVVGDKVILPYTPPPTAKPGEEIQIAIKIGDTILDQIETPIITKSAETVFACQPLHTGRYKLASGQKIGQRFNSAATGVISKVIVMCDKGDIAAYPQLKLYEWQGDLKTSLAGKALTKITVATPIARDKLLVGYKVSAPISTDTDYYLELEAPFDIPPEKFISVWRDYHGDKNDPLPNGELYSANNKKVTEDLMFYVIGVNNINP